MMNKFLRTIRSIVLLLVILFTGLKVNASHLYGGDLYYKWISGNTYQITLACYGDCSGGAFPTFHTSIAEIQVYRGATLDTTLELPCLDTAGTEVTPVCAKEKNNTACNGGTLPGIKKFVFQGNVTLKGVADDWVFVFNGNLSSSSAGRSGSITNLSSAGTMVLLDTLNNLDSANSSAEFTTIPTPFFCINELANYNPGAVDPDGDSLIFKLVPGITGVSAGTVSYVTYAAGYDYAKYPIAVKSPAASNFVLDSTTGQLTFTPNTIQRSLVVEQVNKYNKDGILVGTSMREMTVVVISCTTKPPTGVITNNDGGKITTDYDYTVCQSQGVFNFHIDPTSPDGTNVTATATGLPPGAKYTVTGNGTKTPSGVFTWDASKAAPGLYKFFVTFQNDACPLSSRQTLVYTLYILPSPIMSFKQTSLADCNHKGAIQVSSSEQPWTEQIWADGKIIDSTSNLTLYDTLIDSLAPLAAGHGKYKISVVNWKGCATDTNISIAKIPDIGDSAIITKPSCYGLKNGAINLIGLGGAKPLTYHLDGHPDKLNGRYDSLATGVYKITITDSVNCAITVPVVVTQPDSLHLAIVTAPNECTGTDDNGRATVSPFGGTPPYTYFWDILQPKTTAAISGMSNGTYRIYVKDAKGCTDSSIAVIGYDNCCTPFVPSAFSPNNDGRNDKFRIRYRGDMKLINLSIYNRYGQRVYFSIYPDEGWDGTFNGVPQEMGTYIYFIKATCGSKGDNVIELKGDLTLVR